VFVQPLSQEQQVDLVARLWNSADARPVDVGVLAGSSAGVGVPLQCRLLAEAFAVPEPPPPPPLDLDLVRLLAAFQQRRWNAYRSASGWRADDADPAFQYLRLAADRRLMDLAVDQVLRRSDAVPEAGRAERLLDSVLSQLGVVQLEGRRPRFLHHTVAEFHAARHWLQALKEDVLRGDKLDSFLEQILAGAGHVVVRSFLDRLLADQGEEEQVGPFQPFQPLQSAGTERYRRALERCLSEDHQRLCRLVVRLSEAALERPESLLDGQPSALHLCVFSSSGGSAVVLERLLELGRRRGLADERLFRPEATTGATALHWAAERGRRHLVAALINWNAPLFHLDGRRRNALHCAAQGGHGPVLRLLLDAAAARTQPPAWNTHLVQLDASQRTPLHHLVAGGGDEETVRFRKLHQLPFLFQSGFTRGAVDPRK